VSAVHASATPTRASAFGGQGNDFVRLTAYDTVPADDERGNACHSHPRGFLSYGINLLEILLGVDRS
jgi:hypothetical protein